jgi:hypothetical protein
MLEAIYFGLGLLLLLVVFVFHVRLASRIGGQPVTLSR